MIALKTEQTFEARLEIEALRPAEQRTVFVFRFLSADRLIALDEATDQADAIRQGEGKPEAVRAQVEALLLSGINPSLVAIRRGALPGGGPAVEFSVELDIESPLEPHQRTVLVAKMLDLGGLEAAEKLCLDSGGQSLKAQVATLRQVIGRVVPASEASAHLLEHASIGELKEIAGKCLRFNRVLRISDAVPLPAGALPIDELWDLAFAMIRNSRLTEIDRKKSALQSASAAMGRSAGSARGAMGAGGGV